MLKISVIVPVYNVEQYLNKCLESLVNQTLEDIEILVVNDGTRDESQKIIDDYVKQNPKKVFSFTKENGGLSSARNFGLEKATGDYIAFVDSDDYVDVNMYEAMYLKAKESNFDLVICDFNEIRAGKILQCSCKLKNDCLEKEAVKEAMVDFYPSAWNKIYKKTLFDKLKIQFKEGVWFEDVEFIYRLLPYVETIGVVHQNFYQYLIRDNSITGTVDPRIYHYIDNWNGLIEYYKFNEIYEEYYDIVEYCYARYLFATFIKSATKFPKNEFNQAVHKVLYNVKKNFPQYKKNRFINGGGFKNLYLKHFSKTFADIIFLKANLRKRTNDK